MKSPHRKFARRLTLSAGILVLLGCAAVDPASGNPDKESGRDLVHKGSEYICFGKKATVVGGRRVENTEGDNDEQFTRVYIDGTEGDDVIVGTGEIDIVYARGGDDRVCGLGGNDLLHGGSGFDLCDGGPGRDNLSDTCEAP